MGQMRPWGWTEVGWTVVGGQTGDRGEVALGLGGQGSHGDGQWWVTERGGQR